MKNITIRVLKYDGQLHAQWDAEILRDSDGIIVALARPGTEILHHTKGFSVQIDKYILAAFEAAKWYNVLLDFDMDGSPKRVYCNASLPVERKPGAVEWADLDLDVVQMRGEAPHIEDEEEFEANNSALQYPPQVVAAARDVVSFLMNRAEEGTPPFCWWDMEEALAYYMHQ